MLFLTSPLLIFPPPPVSLFAAHLSFFSVHSPHPHPFTTCHPVTLLHPLYSQLLSVNLRASATPSLFFSHCCSSCLSLLTANICDEEMLLCQNGGTCYQNQKCICPPEFKGILCQQSRCEAGKDCNAASSLHSSVATLLLCTLLAHLLATLAPHWATNPTPLRPRSVFMCVYVRWGVTPERVGGHPSRGPVDHTLQHSHKRSHSHH